MLAAVAGIAVGHLVAGLTIPDASPVVAVSANVIESTPESLKQWAIRRFGNDDKAVLIGSVVAVTLLMAVIAGIAARRHLRVGLGFVALLGATVILAAHRSDTVDHSAGPLPGTWMFAGLASTVTAAVTLVLLRRLALGEPLHGPLGTSSPATASTKAPVPPSAIEHPTDHAAVGHRPGQTARRRFLTGAAVAAGGSLVAGSIGRRLATAPPVDELTDLRIASPAPRLPTGLDAKVPGITPFRTPRGEFYRVDTALVVPRLDRDRWRLTIDGDVDRRLVLSFTDLVRDFDLIERDLTLNCVSNEVGGPYASSGRWVGVRTADLLERAGVRGNVDQILSRSSDGMTISTPIQALTDGREAMVAIGFDGGALPRERGYPARLLTPGLYGFVGATKWLVGLKATTYAADSAYWTDRGWVTDAPVKTQSRIDTPRGFAKIPAGRVRVGGVAWAQRRGIEAVEIQVDDGPWRTATLGAEANVDYWRQWFCDVDLVEPGRHDLRVRATDGTGAVQTDQREPPFPSGASGLASVTIQVI